MKLKHLILGVIIFFVIFLLVALEYITQATAITLHYLAFLIIYLLSQK